MVIGSSVKVARRHDIVSCVSEGRDGHKLRRLSRGGCYGCDSTFKGGNSLLEDIDGRLFMCQLDEVWESSRKTLRELPASVMPCNDAHLWMRRRWGDNWGFGWLGGLTEKFDKELPFAE